MGNTGIQVTEDKVKQVLVKCAAGLQDSPVALEVISVDEIGKEIVNRRTKCWKVTVPYSMKETMQLSSLYPNSWTHRRYFQPREKRVPAVTSASVQSGGEAGRGVLQQEKVARGQEDVVARGEVARGQEQEPMGEVASGQEQEETASSL